DPKPDYKIARNWESGHTKKQVYLYNPTFIGQGIGSISGGTSSKREAPVPENQNYNEVPKRAKIEDWFQPRTPPHQIYSRNAYPHWVQESRIMDYYLMIQKIVPYTKVHIGINESPVEASPSKASRTYDASKTFD
ncbi:461_t:CDS:2, partial [Paraglomus occultum]